MQKRYAAGKGSRLKGEPNAQADRARHCGFARREGFAGGPGSLASSLERLLPQVRPVLVNALAKTPSLEVRRRIESLLALPTLVVRDVQSLRDIRGVQVLEHIAAWGADATRLAAIDLLKKLAAGAPEARLTQEAKAAVDRWQGLEGDGGPDHDGE
jgi:hypothetical protein